MCNAACLDFARTVLRPAEIHDKIVLEVGSLDVNGCVRPIVEMLKPSRYIGVDTKTGPGVDQVCDAAELVECFGEDSIDVLISTELLEHVRDWRAVVSNFKRVLKRGAVLLITTRSRHFPYHGYPFDFWRYEMSDMEILFQDFSIERMEPDPLAPGVFIKARKPFDFTEVDLSNHSLYSIVTAKMTRDLATVPWLKFRVSQFAASVGRQLMDRIADPFRIVTCIKRVLNLYLDQRYPGWSVDEALRYLPLISIIERVKLGDCLVLDVGSGPQGISKYSGKTAVGVDPAMMRPSTLLKGIQGSALFLPFRDRSVEVVTSADMLEHLPPDERNHAISEMVRVANRLLIIGVPCGLHAELHDRKVAAFYELVHGITYRFCTEHLTFSLPRDDALLEAILAATRALGRRCRIRISKSANLWLRSVYMRAWVREAKEGSSRLSKMCLVLLPLIKRITWGPCYRRVFEVRFETTK